MDHPMGVKLVVKILRKTIHHEPCYDGALAGLSQVKSSSARKLIEKLSIKSSTPWRVRILLIEVIEKWHGQEGWESLVKNIHASKEKVALSAIRTLAKKGVLRKEVIDNLIQRMKKLDKKKGVVWEDCRLALKALLGVEFYSAREYSSWVSLRGYKRSTSSQQKKDSRRATGERITFFGMPLSCKRSVFIIDVSGSMKTIDPPELDGSGHYGTTRRDAQGEPKLDLERMRIRRAKKELIQVIRKLKSSQFFNIIAYSHDVWVWSKRGCKPANSSNKKSAIKFVQSFKAEGVTVTDLALAKAYQTNPKAECFYLLSDGAPTRDGTNIIPTEQILELVLKLDRFRKVKIHTLGFRGAKVDFMKALANLTAGTYRDIR